jgi:predicted  nucleic acid-binding Zn-ribbon protein
MSETEMLSTENKLLRQQVASMEEALVKLRERIEWFERQMFGVKSEKYISNDQQCELDFGDNFSPDQKRR